MGIRDFVILLLGYGCVPLAACSAYYGLLAYCWLSFMRPQSLVWSQDVQSARITLVVAVVLLLRAAVTAGAKVRFAWSTIVFVGLWAWLAVSTFSSSHSDLSYPDLIQFSKAAVAMVLITGLVRSRMHLKWLFVLLAACPGVWALKLGLFFVTSGGGTSNQGGPAGMDNNDTALFLAMAVPLLVFGANEIRQRWGRRIMYAMALLAGPAVFVTASRGGLLALAMAVFMTVWRKSQWWKAAMLLTVLGGIGWAIVPDKAMNRYETIGAYQKDSSAMGRINAWKTAVAMANDRPLTGVGIGTNTFMAEYNRYKALPEDRPHVAHSVWFSMLGEAGYVGLGLLVTLIGTVLVSTQRIMGMARSTVGNSMSWAWNYAAGLQGAILTYIVGGSFLSQNRFEFIYAILMLSVPLAFLANTSRESTHSVLQAKPTSAQAACPEDRPSSARPANC